MEPIRWTVEAENLAATYECDYESDSEPQCRLGLRPGTLGIEGIHPPVTVRAFDVAGRLLGERAVSLDEYTRQREATCGCGPPATFAIANSR